MGCGDEKLSKYLTQIFTAHCNVMIYQQVTLSGDAEWPKVADAVIEATLSTTTDGTTIRRMPNLVTFRDDPDAMLVMALEHYDEGTGTAEKAAIMHHDVVGRRPPLTTVPSAEEGLLVSLDQRGVVDLPYIATLYEAPVRQIIAELGDLIYQDPETQAWETADVYQKSG